MVVVLVGGALVSCATGPSASGPNATRPLAMVPAPPIGHRILAVSWTLPDSIVVAEQSGDVCSAQSLSAAGVSRWQRALPFCPDRADVVAGGMVLFQTAGQSLLLGGDGSASPVSSPIVAAASAALVLDRSHGVLEVAGTGIRIPDHNVAASSIADRGGQPTVVVELQDESGSRTLVREPGHRLLTPAFPALDSFDLSSDGREVLFSARRSAGGFDAGLVSTDGGDIHWLPGDPADEVAVRWAPLGYRAGYLIRRPDGDLFRSIQISTAAQLLIDFPLASAASWSWSPDASRIAVVTSTPVEADHVDIVSIDGVVRRSLVAPRRRADLNAETFEGLVDTILTRPTLLKYNETVPLVIWTGEGSPLRWDDVRGDLAASARVASVVTPRPLDGLTPDFWQRIKSMRWIDSSRVYVVGAGPRPATLPVEATLIEALTRDDAPSGYREEHSGHAETVLLTARSSAVVKSLAASYIIERLKGTSPPNDHR